MKLGKMIKIIKKNEKKVNISNKKLKIYEKEIKRRKICDNVIKNINKNIIRKKNYSKNHKKQNCANKYYDYKNLFKNKLLKLQSFISIVVFIFLFVFSINLVFSTSIYNIIDEPDYNYIENGYNINIKDYTVSYDKLKINYLFNPNLDDYLVIFELKSNNCLITKTDKIKNLDYNYIIENQKLNTYEIVFNMNNSCANEYDLSIGIYNNNGNIIRLYKYKKIYYDITDKLLELKDYSYFYKENELYLEFYFDKFPHIFDANYLQIIIDSNNELYEYYTLESKNFTFKIDNFFINLINNNNNSNKKIYLKNFYSISEEQLFKFGLNTKLDINVDFSNNQVQKSKFFKYNNTEEINIINNFKINYPNLNILNLSYSNISGSGILTIENSGKSPAIGFTIRAYSNGNILYNNFISTLDKNETMYINFNIQENLESFYFIINYYNDFEELDYFGNVVFWPTKYIEVCKDTHLNEYYGYLLKNCKEETINLNKTKEEINENKEDLISNINNVNSGGSSNFNRDKNFNSNLNTQTDIILKNNFSKNTIVDSNTNLYDNIDNNINKGINTYNYIINSNTDLNDTYNQSNFSIINNKNKSNIILDIENKNNLLKKEEKNINNSNKHLENKFKDYNFRSIIYFLLLPILIIVLIIIIHMKSNQINSHSS